MATSPAFAATPRNAVAQISTANTNRDGTGTIGTVFTAGSSGSKVEEVVAEATGSVTAGMVRLFIHDGTTAYLWDEILVSATTPSGTAQTFRARKLYDNLQLPSGYSLRAATNNAETFNIYAAGGDY